MKVYINNDDDPIYITDIGTGHDGKPCKLDYLWIGSDDRFVGTIADKELISLDKAIARIKKLNKYSKYKAKK